MTREEEIRNAIDTIIPIHPSEKGRTYEQSLMATGFEAGVVWADMHPVNVWHDREDIPKPNSWILIQNNKGGYDTLKIMSCMPSSNWSITCKVSSIYKWTYISDLLPKGSEK